jgi:hypothetical protein
MADDFKDFDADREATVSVEPVTFGYFGRVWSASEISDDYSLDLMASNTPGERSRAFRAIMERLVVDDPISDPDAPAEDPGRMTTQRALFNRYKRDGRPPETDPNDANTITYPGSPPMKAPEQEKLMEYVVGKQKGRPTSPSSNSSSSLDGTGPDSAPATT